MFLIAGLIATLCTCTGNSFGQGYQRNPQGLQQDGFLPPVHLAPDNVLRQKPVPVMGPRQAVRSHVSQASAFETTDNPFQELEQDLAMPMPPPDRISQTPARPETRPAATNRPVRPSQSVVGQQLDGNGSILNRQIPLADPHTGLSNGVGQAEAAKNQLRSPAHNAGFSRNGNPVWQDESLPDPQSAVRQDRRSAVKDCEEYRQLLLNSPVSTVTLDISPQPRGVEFVPVHRDWSDIFGQPICSGSLVELSRGYAIIDTADGLVKIAVARLGENDQAAIAEAWRFPKACLVSSDVFEGRCWIPQTMTWHASNLCHKPLYFEDIQLERYGHSDGPIMQPIRSTGRFLISLATLPYQTGIHPPNECQYALGYYRPGSCAPWLGYPVPISARGAVNQAAFMLTGAYTIF